MRQHGFRRIILRYDHILNQMGHGSSDSPSKKMKADRFDPLSAFILRLTEGLLTYGLLRFRATISLITLFLLATPSRSSF